MRILPSARCPLQRGLCLSVFFPVFMRSFFQCDTIRSKIVTARTYTIIRSHSDPCSSSTLFLPLPLTPVTISTGFVCILPNFLYENTSIYAFKKNISHLLAPRYLLATILYFCFLLFLSFFSNFSTKFILV